MPDYTNTRASKVSVAGVDFNPGETKSVPEKFIEAMERKGPDGLFVNPLRRGPRPILQPGRVTMPEPKPQAKPGTLDSVTLKAMAQIRLCSDLDLLATWHASETRLDVVAAIATRAQELAKK